MRVFLLNDLHFGVRNSNQIFLDDVKSVFENLVEHLEHDDEIYILGDVFDNRNSITIKAMNCANECFRMVQNHKITIIPGNHDIHYVNKLKPNSIDPLLDTFDNIEILYEPTYIQFGQNKILMVPWIVPSDTIQWSLIIKKSDADICMGHFDIQGFRLNSKTFNKSHGFEARMFSKFDKVYSGHYHFASKDRNICYLGTQYQMTWDDFGETKAFHCLDEEGNLTKIPCARQTFVRQDFAKPLDQTYKNCFVRLSVNSDVKNQKIKDKVEELLSLGAHEVKVIQNIKTDLDIDTQDVVDTLVNSTDMKTVIQDVAKNIQVDEGIDYDKLMLLVDDIVSEAWEEMGEV